MLLAARSVATAGATSSGPEATRSWWPNALTATAAEQKTAGETGRRVRRPPPRLNARMACSVPQFPLRERAPHGARLHVPAFTICHDNSRCVS